MAVMLTAAILNAAAFTGGNAIYRALEGDHSASEERKRHDLALEKLTKDTSEWNEDRLKMIDYINTQREKARQTNSDFSDAEYAMSQLDEILIKQPKLEHYYISSKGQKEGEWTFVIGGTVLSALITHFVL